MADNNVPCRPGLSVGYTIVARSISSLMFWESRYTLEIVECEKSEFLDEIVTHLSWVSIITPRLNPDTIPTSLRLLLLVFAAISPSRCADDTILCRGPLLKGTPVPAFLALQCVCGSLSVVQVIEMNNPKSCSC